MKGVGREERRERRRKGWVKEGVCRYGEGRREGRMDRGCTWGTEGGKEGGKKGR